MRWDYNLMRWEEASEGRILTLNQRLENTLSCVSDHFHTLSAAGTLIDTYGGCGRVGLEKVPLRLTGPARALSTRLQPTSDFYQLFKFRLEYGPGLSFCPRAISFWGASRAQPPEGRSPLRELWA